MSSFRVGMFALWRNFAIVGGLGFVTEAVILQLLTATGLVGPYLARCVSFPVAVTLTWLLNRRLTFATRSADNPGRRYVLYALGQVVAALANLGTYAALVYLEPRLRGAPVLALGGGAVVGLVINFWWADQVVFARDLSRGERAP
jgi:putative flippase GtrA